MKTIWCSLVLAVSAVSVYAANYTVKSGGGGNYTTIQACATAMSDGDTCTVYAGTYNENVTVSAGSVDAYKTLTVNPGDTVYVLSFSMGSYDKINGFHIQNPSSPNSKSCVTIAANATFVFITNNSMYACAAFVNEAHNSNQNTTYVFIQGNTMSYSCSTSSAPNPCTAMYLEGDHQLLENNDISHVSDGPYMSGQYIVLRKNNFHDTSASECGSNSSNCHIDFMQVDATVPGNLPTHYILYESNAIHDMTGGNGHGMGLFQAEVCNNNCSNAIVRFNVDSHISNGAIIDDNSGSTSVQGWRNVKSYNNSWVDMNTADAATNGSGTNGYYHNSTGGSGINELFYYPQASMPNFNPIGVDSSSLPFNYGHSLAWCTGTCTLRNHMYGSGSWTDDAGNIKADPLFVNYAGNDFHLQAGSPAIGAGTYLTTASGSGSNSTLLTVTDASYFQDGMGFSSYGVQADWIRIGTSTTVQISSINYSTNVITLATPVSWTSGAGVYLYKDSSGNVVLNGASPDIGAYPDPVQTAGPPPAPPSNLTVVLQ